MIRMPLATASLLAIAISLAGCGEGKDKAAAPQAPAAASTPAPAAAPAGQVDEAAAKAVVAHYADMVFAVYSDAESTAKTLQTAIDTFLANPNDDTLKAARTAWIAARVPYLQSEVFRFGNTIIDDWEGQVNAWPLDEGLIDYVDKSYEHALGNPGATANIIANTEVQVGEDKVDVKDITPEKLASLNELGGSEANVATGYQAIIGVRQLAVTGEARGPGAGEQRLKARVLADFETSAQGIQAQAVDGQRHQPFAVQSQQGCGVAGQQGAQSMQQAPIALALGQVAGQIVHQRQQGGQQQFCSHFDLV